MGRKLGSKNKVKEVVVEKKAAFPRVMVKKSVEAKPEPVVASVEVPKELPVVDGYQVVRVFVEDHDGHTQTHLLCEAEGVVSKDRVRLHVKKELL